MLCRTYLKGRDWYDFNWYVKQKTIPNFKHLQAALWQWGGWKHQEVTVDTQWLVEKLSDKINRINWLDAATDVERFLPSQEQHSLKLWSSNFFLHKVNQLQSYS